MNAVTSWLETVAGTASWQSVLRSRAPQIAVWVLALALGVQAALIVTRLGGADRSPASVAQPSFTAGPARQGIDLALVTRSHLFGAPAVVAPVADAAHAPPTSMALVLTGTIPANRPNDGLAILGPNASAAKVYAVGQNVPGGARLHAVYDDRVLLERDGRLEALMLPRQLLGGPAPRTTALRPESSFERFRRVLTQDPGVVGDVMRPTPVFADGRQRGYRVYPGRNRQAFMSLGLRPGDLVVAINNTPLDDPARGEEIFRTLSSASEAHVTVMRNGRTQDLTLNMSQIASEADQLAGQDSGAVGGTDAAGLPGPPPGRE